MNGGFEGSSNGEDRDLIEVRLEFQTMRQLQAELAPTLSNDGFFIPTPDPSPPDTVLRFFITLPEDFVLIEGTGVVIWVRQPGEEEGPAGMAVRYISLSRETQETIDAVIDAHLASGRELFDLEPTAPKQATYPTDALGGSQPIGFVDDDQSERNGTARQLEYAKVTIRGASEDKPEATPEEIDNEYLSSVEAQVEEAVASIAPLIDVPASDDRSIERVVGLLNDDEEPAPDTVAPPTAHGPEIVVAEPVEPIIVDEDPVEIDPGLEVEDDPQVRPSEAEAAATADPAGGGEETGEREEAIESLIPVFLEKWKQEIDGDSSEANGEIEDARIVQPEAADAPADAGQTPEINASKTVAIDLGFEEPADDQPPAGAGPVDPTLGIEIPDEAASEVESSPGDEPVDRLGAEFEISGFDPMPDSDIVMAPQRPADDGEVTLVPSEPPRSRGPRLILLIPALLVVVVAISVYFGWDRILGFVEGMRSSAQTAQVTDPEVGGPVEATPAPLEADSSTDAATSREEPAVSMESAPAASAEESIPPVPTPVPQTRYASQPATRIDSVTWRTAGEGTEVTILGNGRIDRDSVTVFPMSDPARVLVRVRNIDEKYPQYEIAVGSAQVGTIRIGHHPEQSPPALYVVLDLVDPLAGVADFRVEGDTVRIAIEAQ